ncbi:MAG: cysteine--tRNA ligase, partial [Planctomycetota bacterium]
MSLHVYNSLRRRLEAFEPADPRRVTLYACGPTVYSFVHIGNWSFNLICDVFVRWLRASGYGVHYVMNITDVEDKIIRDAREAGMERAAFVKRWEDAFFEDLEALGCIRADDYPHATAFVEPMVAMIQKLLDKGHAYVVDEEHGSASIYFRVASFPHYGELANLSKAAIRDGASGRVKADEYEKERVGDFALWKGWVPEDGDAAWEPTFVVDGEPRVVKGRPGWHIECSVMSTSLLGDQIDLHLGGEDLRFPHHQNEIAQSEAATGKEPFVRYWMHRRYLLVDGQKMSKSKGNFYTLRDLEERFGPSAPRAFRYLVVSAHYRKPIDFTWTGLEAAARTLRNLDDAHARIRDAAGEAEASDFGREAEAAFAAALDNDLEASAAMAAIHGLVGEANRRLAAGTLTPGDAAGALRVLGAADQVLGLGLGRSRGALNARQQALFDARQEARAREDWAASDRLRNE